jgi:hypothetical protein
MILDRSLEDRASYCDLKDKNRLILDRLADGECFQNNRRMIVKFTRPFISRLFRVIRSMINLEKLHLLECNLTLTEDLPQLFRSCPELTELRIRLSDLDQLERERLTKMNEDVKNELRSGFQRLRLLELHLTIYSCPKFQEMFT